MRVGLHIAGTATPRAGGEYTFIEGLLGALAPIQHHASHEFVLCYEEGARGLTEQFSNFETISLEEGLSPANREASITGLMHRNGINFNVFMQYWATSTFDIPYATHLWDLQHRNNPWFPEVSYGGAWEQREQLISRVLRRAAIIFTGSHTSLEEIIRFYAVPKQHISVLPFPTPQFALDASLLLEETERSTGDFIFYPAQFWPHKNHVLLIDACKVARDRGWDLHLVFVGADKGNRVFLQEYCETLGINHAVNFLGYVEQKKLVELYATAFCLAFPTYCGPDNLPPLEAFGLGCPVLASDIPGARQQYGDAALYFDPTSVDDFYDKLQCLRVAENRERLLIVGKIRAKAHTWNNYATGFVAALDGCWPFRRTWSLTAEPTSRDALAPVRLGIDLRFITREATGGITPLIVQSLKALYALAPHWHFHIFCTIFNRDLVGITGTDVHYHCLPLSHYYSCMDKILVDEHIDVLFRSFPNDDNLEFPSHKQIVLVPDLQHDYLPDLFSSESLENRRKNFSRLITQAGAVATISLHAASTIRKRYKACSQIFVMYPASPLKEAENKNVSSDFMQSVASLEPYFLFPANLWRHKNHETLLKAFAILREDARFEHYKLILTGHLDPARWEEIALSCPISNVHHLGFCSKAELVFLYRHAVALTFPSLFEGFGMPVLEAFGLECPVLCSNTTSLPEVAAGAALLCDPNNKDSIAQNMKQLASSESLKREYITRGRERFGDFSWAAAAAKLREATERIANNQNASNREKQKPLTPPSYEVLVSIVTPSLNQAQFLSRTIESVLKQTYPKIEYIVIDGGSTDGTLDLLKSYGARLRWVSEPDRGQTDAINKGFARCSGQVFAYLNSDDTLEPDAVEKVVAFFEANPDIGLVYGNANYIDIHDNIIGTYRTDQWSFERLIHDCCICQPAAFWRSSVADHIGQFDANLHYAMDYDFWLRIAKAEIKTHFLEATLANSRMYPENKTSSARKQIFNEIFAVSLKHAGRVSHNYVEGYWTYRLYEQNDVKAKIGRTIPYLKRALVEYYAYRYAMPGRSRLQAARYLAKLIASRLSLRSKTIARPILQYGVLGVFHDNWLASKVILAPSPKRRGTLVLTGRSPIDCVMRIRSGDQLISERQIRSKELARIEFQGSGEALAFEFEPSVMVDGRDLAFQVEYTDCFSEDEI